MNKSVGEQVFTILANAMKHLSVNTSFEAQTSTTSSTIGVRRSPTKDIEHNVTLGDKILIRGRETDTQTNVVYVVLFCRRLINY